MCVSVCVSDILKALNITKVVNMLLPHICVVLNASKSSNLGVRSSRAASEVFICKVVVC